MFKFFKGISAFRRSRVSLAKSAPIPIRFPRNVLSLSLTAAFFRIFVLYVYLERLRGSVWDSFCFCLIVSKYDEHAQFRRIHTMFPNTGARLWSLVWKPHNYRLLNFQECYKTPSYKFRDPLQRSSTSLLATLILPSASYFLSFQ